MHSLTPSLLRRFLAAALPTLLAGGCVPYLADQQSARILPRGEWELTPSFSYVSFSIEDESDHIQDQYGVRVGYGLSDAAELRATFEHIAVEDEPNSFNMLGVGVKFGLVRDQIALYLPVGLLFGEDLDVSETWTIAPTLLATLRPSQRFELTPSLKAIYPFASEDPELFLGFHLGAGISTDLDRWAFRPELGLVKNPGEEGTTWGFTVGFSIRP
jgi:hypothetical protein